MKNKFKHFIAFISATIVTITLTITSMTMLVHAAAINGLSNGNIQLEYSNSKISGDTFYTEGKCNWTAKDTTINGLIKGRYGKLLSTYYEADTTLTIKNTGTKTASLSFDYSVSFNQKGSSSLIIDGETVVTSSSEVQTHTGTFTKKELLANSSITVKLVAGKQKSDNTATLILSNIKLEAPTTATFSPVNNGNYTVDGMDIASKTEVSKESGELYSVSAIPEPGYTFYSWYNETTTTCISYDASCSLSLSSDAMIYPIFIKQGAAVFDVSGKVFDDLTEAVTYAQSNGKNKIVLVGNGKLTGNHTIPSEITLLIPFDDAHTCYTDVPGNVGNTNSKPSEYRTLTMASDSSITVNGVLSVSAQHSVGNGGKKFAGSPSGPCGFIKMVDNSNIIVNNGGVLYAWGYITGNGTVTVESGAKVYENMQIADFRGGEATADIEDTVFPFSQYYVQNIEAKEILKAGAEEYVRTSIVVSGITLSSSVKFISSSSDAMFAPAAGAWVSKVYEPNTDRLRLDAYGDMELNSISVSAKGDGLLGSLTSINIDSSKYILPINNNISINIHSGTTTINQDVALQAGSSVTIDEGASLKISTGKNVYIYDETEWMSGKFAFTSNFVPVIYSPTRAYTRKVSDLVDARVDINGTIVTDGFIYTTENGAQIISSGGNGKIVMNGGAGTNKVTYQINNNVPTPFVEIPITSAKLQNDKNLYGNTEEFYTETAGVVAGDTFYWNNSKDKWMKATDVTITFKKNDGTDTENIQTVTKETILSETEYELKKDVFKREYCTFLDWNTKEDGTGKEYSNGEKVYFLDDTTLYAQWEGEKHNVTFLNEDATEIAIIEQEYGQTIKLPENVTKEGHRLVGWNTKSDGTGTQYTKDSTADFTEDTILYPQWQVNQYTITFDTDGGSEIEAITQDYGTEIEVSKAPTKEGYTFTGWEPTIPETMPAENLTVKAQWTINQYTVTFDTAGGSEIEKITQNYGTEIAAPEDPTKEGYTFTGWDEEVPTTMPAENVTITAKWQVNQYTITFDTDGGSAIDPITQDYATEVTAPTTPTKTGYTFEGWDKDVPTTMPAENVRITAKWKVNQYTITFDTDGGSAIDPITQDYATEVEAPTNPTKTGYTFVSWDVEIPETMPAKNVRITAKWKVNQYTITFDTDGGSAINPITQDYNTAVEGPTAPTKTGYTFAGWNKEIPETMPAENIVITAKWNINKYTVTWVDENGTELEKDTEVPYNTNPTYDGGEPTKESTAQYSYKFAGWTPSIGPVTKNITYTATYTESVNKYLITWVNDDAEHTVLAKEEVAYGETPTYPGEKAPEKESTAQYSYTFNGWTPEVKEVTGEAAYTAVYEATVNKYTVTFKNYDGAVLKTGEVAYGEMPGYTGTPTRAADDQYSYIFKGWDKEITAVTENVEYTATYNENLKYYAITWLDEDGTTLQTSSVAYGEKPKYNEKTPSKEATAEYTYTFEGWTPEVKEVTGAATYTATFTATKNKYTITWLDENGEEVLYTEDVEYGATPVYKGDAELTKPATAEYTYTFAGWTPEVKEVTGTATYKATYTATKNSYKITWVDEAGSEVLYEQTLEYGVTPKYKGETPSKPATAEYTYTFAGWTPEVKEVTGVATYKATFTATKNKYTITWLDENGEEVLYTEDVEYGETPEYKGKTPGKAATAEYTYAFAGWTPEVSAVTGKTSYKATYAATKNSYVVTWVDEDGTELDKQTLEYGAVPEYQGETPSKEATAEYTYEFKGWDKEITTVTEKVNYTATYKATKNKYTVKWLNEDGSLIKEERIEYGKTPVYDGETPTKTSTLQYHYTFAGWSPAISAVTGNAEYKANFNEIENGKYSIVFYDKMSGTTIATITDYVNAEITAPADPEKEGYTFKGWDLEVPETMPENGMTINAVWEINQYSIKFVDVDGSEIATVTQNYGTKVTAPANPEKEGYTFNGWDKEIPATMPAENVTITAKWEINQYTITFDTDGGTEIAPMTQNYGSEITAPENPKKEGYTFVGWDKEIPATMPAENVTITAKWNTNKYEIKWDIDGDGEANDTTYVEFGKMPVHEAGSKTATPEYTYEFIGWSPELVTVTKEAVYTAQFKEIPNEYMLIFSDGEKEISSKKVAYGTAIEAPAAPEKTGYTFVGWNQEIPATMPAENITITAQWKVNQYTITFITDGGTEIVPMTQDYGSAITTPADPVKEGYTFKGWNQEIPATMPAENITITAKWELNVYTISWDTDGDGKVDAITKVKHGATPSYLEGSKAADDEYTYTFDRWDPVVEAAKDNITYTALFTKTKNVYAISWDTDGDGNVDDTTDVAYGDMPTHAPGSKANDEKYTYTFKGWDTELSAVTGIKTYTAQFDATPVEYTITFNTDGGTVIPQITAGYGTEIKTPVDPEKVGYTFKGWDGEIPTTMPVNGAVLNAVWEINQYTITFDTDGGTAVDSITADYEAIVETPEAPEKTGYTFAGWSPAVPATMPAENMTLTAQWTINQYTITFDTDGGSEVAPITADYNTAITVPENPTKTGYTFAGWDKEIPEVMPAENRTVKALWDANEYTITFVTDDEENPYDVVTQDYGTEIELPEDPTREGYIFGGWSPALDLTMPAEDMTVYATWNVDQYTITFITDGGTTIDPITQDFDTEVTAPEDPEKTGYTFAGWDVEIPETMPAQNVTITAQWTINQYTITFDTDGGSEIAPVVLDYAAAIETPEAPTKNGYTFTGWTPELPVTMPAEDINVKAIWDANEYVITFNTNGGSEIEAITADCGDQVTAPENPEKEGYTFAGWDAAFPETMPAGGLTLNAKWVAKEYVISWDTNGDGEVDDTTLVAYDTKPEHEAGSKAADAEYTYEFTGWNPEITEVKGTAIYTAVFKEIPNEYQITFDTDGGSVVETVTYAYGTRVTAPEAPVKEGYTFDGWAPALPETMPAENVTVVAQWKVNDYTIIFDTDGGSEIKSLTAGFGTAVSVPEVPTKEGYTFEGWNPEVPETMPAKDMTLTAQWAINQYTITFDTDGGNVIAPITQDYGTEIIAPENPTKEDYTFVKWNVEIPETMPANNMTITAEWRYSYTGWKTDDKGTTYLSDGEMAYFSTWAEIEGSKYYFDGNGYIVKGLYTTTSQDESHQGTFLFNKETGVFEENLTTVYVEGEDIYYVESGEVAKDAGLIRWIKEDGEVNYYYFDEEGKAVKNETILLNTDQTNGMLPSYYYEFGADGVIPHDEDTSKNGVIKESDGKYYYIDGIKVYMGVFKVGNNYYYANNKGKLYTDGVYWVSRTNDLVEASFYDFDKEGKMTVNGAIPEDKPDDPTIEQGNVVRIYGDTRYETSLAVANKLKEELGIEKFDTVILASGENYPDALSGAYLAALKNAPIIMVKESNAALIREYVRENMKTGGTIYLLGGIVALPGTIVEGMNGYTIKRLSGDTRYETNLEILKEAFKDSGASSKEILVCSGKSFADSLSASATKKPILLVDKKLSAVQKDFLESLNVEKIYIIGLEAAVNVEIESAVQVYGAVERVGGPTRYETSVEIAKVFFDSPEKVVLASAKNFPDGLSAGPLAVCMEAPLVLTNTGNESAAIAYAQQMDINTGAILGGSTIISDNTVRTIFTMDANSEIIVKKYND